MASLVFGVTALKIPLFSDFPQGRTVKLGIILVFWHDPPFGNSIFHLNHF
jgi:hypothetical protein